MIRVSRHPRGPRLYVLGLRCHHGLAAMVGSALAALVPWRTARALGYGAMVALEAHDARDFPYRDRDGH
ncbi:MAG: hypothetical protein ACRD2Z_03265 [Thermoanaerobaculia bacterium]